VVVESDSNRWRVRRDGRILSKHYTQMTAMKMARPCVARRDHVELVTHGRDGWIRSKDSYGREGRWRDADRPREIVHLMLALAVRRRSNSRLQVRHSGAERQPPQIERNVSRSVIDICC